jgi:hypothetical protein
MKKLLLSTLILLTLALAACSSTSTGTPTSATNNDLSIETQLAVGTLQLAGSEQDVSAEQAEELIVYWQVYDELTRSETSSQAEIDGLIEQIQETMTDAQMQAITDMEITQQDVITSTQGVSVVSSNSSDKAVSLPSSSSGMPAGGPPADGGAPPDGAMPVDLIGAAPASGGDSAQSAEASSGLAGSAGVPSVLLEALIQSLQRKIVA